MGWYIFSWILWLLPSLDYGSVLPALSPQVSFTSSLCAKVPGPPLPLSGAIQAASKASKGPYTSPPDSLHFRILAPSPTDFFENPKSDLLLTWWCGWWGWVGREAW